MRCLSFHMKKWAHRPLKFWFVCSWTLKNNSRQVSDSTSDCCKHRANECFLRSLVWLPRLNHLLVSYPKFLLLPGLLIHLLPSRRCLCPLTHHCCNSLNSKVNSLLARFDFPRSFRYSRSLWSIARDRLAFLQLTCHWPRLGLLFHLWKVCWH